MFIRSTPEKVPISFRENIHYQQYMAAILSLPDELLVQLGNYIHNIEDFINLCSTCRKLRNVTGSATPRTILRLAAAQSSTFFRPSPWFLVAATARELGHWARDHEDNERQLASTLERGVEGLLDMALAHCGLTVKRIRQLYLMRFSIINPVTDLIDKCVGVQWYQTPNFWNGGVSDAYTISAEASETLLQLAIYGELFGPDFEAFLGPDSRSRRRLSVETRLEFVKYCIPDFACVEGQTSAASVQGSTGSMDPRRAVKRTGPYTEQSDGSDGRVLDNNLALVWVLRSSRWQPPWKEARSQAGPDFQEGFADDWWSHGAEEEEDDDLAWRQRMWESAMVCQGLEGLGMIRPELRESWTPKIKQWRAQIAGLERAPRWIRVGRQATLEYPFLLGDLRICGSGFVAGT